MLTQFVTPAKAGAPLILEERGSRFHGNDDKGGVALLSLIPHPQSRRKSVTGVTVEVTAIDRDDVLLDFKIHAGNSVVIPEWVTPERADDLWTTTCFELFLKPPGGSSYFEFNFSPSTRWAAYGFDEYRSGRRDLLLSVDPHLEFDPDQPHRLSVDVDLSTIPYLSLKFGLAAVIEERDGLKSYWALAHGSGPPDFHNPACFAYSLPPFDRP